MTYYIKTEEDGDLLIDISTARTRIISVVNLKNFSYYLLTLDSSIRAEFIDDVNHLDNLEEWCYKVGPKGSLNTTVRIECETFCDKWEDFLYSSDPVPPPGLCLSLRGLLSPVASERD